MKTKGYDSRKLSFNRKMVAASSSVSREFNTIHSLLEVDITQVRGLIKALQEKTGAKLSLTAYVVSCLSRTIQHHPEFNAFKKGSRLIQLEDVTIGVLIERKFQGELAPEPLTLHGTQTMSVMDIHTSIRKGQASQPETMGQESGMEWMRYIPECLLRTVIRRASENIRLAKRFGKIAVTAVGMFGPRMSWFIPLSSASVLVTIGGIKKHAGPDEQIREILHLTLSFNHDIVDGAPAARFGDRFIHILESGQGLEPE